MKKIKEILNDEASKIPKVLLQKLLSRKLHDIGISDEALPAALAEHLTTKGDENFLWDDGNDGPSQNIRLSFTEDEIRSLKQDTDSFLNNKLPEIIDTFVKESATQIIKDTEREWPQEKLYEKYQMRHFQDRLDLQWAEGLDPLRMILISSREAGQNFAEKLSSSKAKKGIFRRHAILILHMRACQTALEIVTLLESGLPDGAYARWRTLYEISIVAFVIDQFGDDIAERYLAHDVVSVRESIMNEFKHDGVAYEPTALRGEDKRTEDLFQELLSRFGKSYKGPYGWAAHHLGIKSPRFQDLEAAIDWKTLPPHYKWSSYKVHAGVSGSVRSLGSAGFQSRIHAGAMNIGLDIPAINTAYSLMHVTSLIIGNSTDLETQIFIRSLIILRDKVVEECRKIARKIEKTGMETESDFF
ncbi:DUF5677 domain-containing protein [Rhodospirillum sp. A1_3_36]|uniref:DUF5677 domain-containing protein n=1 Tax=Rhodospirillum sp. A1_3_36 TaxID=3391666 RepID=UPI0039A6EEEA